MSEYHEPVLLQESVEALNIQEGGIYVDATFGGGGHSRLILEKMSGKEHLYAFDQDEDAKQHIPDDARLTFVAGNFRHLKRFMKLYGVRGVDGILADLGVSSHQLNEADRGFSYRFEADLDMRMSQQGGTKASDILNTYEESELQRVFSEYGEVRNTKTLVRAIISERERKSIKTVGDFLLVLDPLIRGKRHRYLAQVFQALRIEVNEEMTVLKEFLEAALAVLKPGGRLVVISYHSLEDRLVKRYLKQGNFKGEMITDDFGNIHRPFKLISKKAIEPSAAEIKANSRSRSAKMRIASKK